MVLESTWMERVANSTPMVDLLSKLNSFLVNRESRLDFPTPESPMRTTVKIVTAVLDHLSIHSAGWVEDDTFEEKL